MRANLDHPLMAGVPSIVQMPHSRWNDVPERITDCGYSILTRDKDGGVDAFVKQRKSLFVFFQGHPEYESNTLLFEYRRDIGRYLRRERDTYPAMPEGYFDRDTVDVLTMLRRRALSNRNSELLGEFPSAQAEQRIANTWSQVATRVYANWLAYLCAHGLAAGDDRTARQRTSYTPPSQARPRYLQYRVAPK